MSTRISRRTMLRGAGVVIALPALDCMQPARAQTPQSVPRRLIAINAELSFYQPNLIPQQAGRDYVSSPYLKPLADLRNDMTIISGVSHPEVDGMHAAYKSWLSAAPHPSASNFRNSISVDQLAAKHIGHHTRFPSLILNSRSSIAANGVPLRPMPFPSALFASMFIEDNARQKAEQVQRLREGRSVLDIVLGNAMRMQQRVGPADRDKLEQYFTSVREAEKELHRTQQWDAIPKPTTDAGQPRNITDRNDIIGRKRQFYDIMYLALVSDSTRLMVDAIGDSNSVANRLPGVTMSYHSLSHHSNDPDKLEQLATVESAHLEAFSDFLRRLKQTKEGDSNLLDRTMVLLGSHMHDGRHNNRNLPAILAGGGFKHGQHLAFDRENNYPLANLYVSMLQRLGLELDQFASSTGTMTGLEPV